MRDMSMTQRIAEQKVRDAFINTCITRAFVSAAPIKASDRTKELDNALARYAMECLTDMGGGYVLLSKALESTSRQKDPMGYAYLTQMKSLAMEAATTVADRIVEDHKNDPNLDEVAKATERIAFTPEETEKLNGGVAKIASDTLANTIQNKVLDTIREEKEAYRKDAELEAEIKDALKEMDPTQDTSGSDDTGVTPPETTPDPNNTAELAENVSQEATESARYDAYLRAVAGPNYVAQHQTIFSRLHEMAMECQLHTSEKTPWGIPFKTMSMVTRRNTFPIFQGFKRNSFLGAMESIVCLGNESMGTPDAPGGESNNEADMHQRTLLTASLIYTFFETLNTMHLYCPGLEEVKNFVERTIPVSNMVEKDRETFRTELNGVIQNAVNGLRKAKEVPEVELVRSDLEAVREACTKSGAFESDLPMIQQKISAVLEQCDARARELTPKAPSAPAMETEMETMLRTRDTLKFSRMCSSYGRKHNVRSIRCKVDPSGQKLSPRYVAMECLDAGGNIVNTATIVLESALDAKSGPAYVESCIRGSKLMDLDKPITLQDKYNGKVYTTIDG